MNVAGIALALLAAVCYAAMSIVARKGMERGGADQGVLVALLINVVLHGAIVAVRAASGVQVDGRMQGIWLFVVSGVLTTLLGRASLYGGIRRIGSSRAAALKNLSPLVTVGGALLFLGEELARLAGLGVLIALCSYLLFVVEGYRRGRAEPSDSIAVAVYTDTGEAVVPKGIKGNRVPVLLMGYLFATAAAGFYGSGTVIRKFGLEAFPDPYVAALVSASAGLIVYVLYLASRNQLRGTVDAVVAKRNVYFVYAGVVSTVAQLAVFVALSLTAVSFVSVVSSSDTILTLFFAAVFLGKSESLNRLVVLAALGVFVGTVLILLS